MQCGKSALEAEKTQAASGVLPSAPALSSACLVLVVKISVIVVCRLIEDKAL